MQDADALLLCSQARTAAAADPFSLILHHASVQDTQLACKLLCVNQGLRSSVQQLLQGQLQLIVEPEKDTCSVHGSHHTPATARGIFAGNVCKLTPWIAKHAALLKGLQLDIERVSAPISEEFAAAPAPPGRACCCCCGPCMNCSWGGNEHAGGPYAGQCMDPLQEQAVTAALELAASTGATALTCSGGRVWHSNTAVNRQQLQRVFIDVFVMTAVSEWVPCPAAQFAGVPEVDVCPRSPCPSSMGCLGCT